MGIELNWLKKRVLRHVIEEEGFQAYEQRSLGEIVFWEVVFAQRESSTSYGALRILGLTCFRDLEREVK